MSNVVRKGLRWTVDTRNLEIISPDKVEDMEASGYETITLMSEHGEVCYVSPKNDGYIRDMFSVKTWHKNIKVYPYEANQAVWEANVREWFRLARKNPKYIARLNLIWGGKLDIDSALAQAEDCMTSFKMKSKSKKGERNGELNNWLHNSRNSYFTRIS